VVVRCCPYHLSIHDEAEAVFLGDDFTIKNGAGEDMFFVDGKAFSFGEKLSFQNMQKNERVFCMAPRKQAFLIV
jgi:uncharacterized protein YxjI